MSYLQDSGYAAGPEAYSGYFSALNTLAYSGQSSALNALVYSG